MALVMYVVQSMLISFGIKLEEELGNFESETARNLHIIAKHDVFFVKMLAGIESVKDVVLQGKEIIDTLEYQA